MKRTVLFCALAFVACAAISALPLDAAQASVGMAHMAASDPFTAIGASAAGFKVVAECVDARSGKRYFPGGLFEPAPDEDQAARLVKAGVIKEISAEDVEKVRAEAKARAEASAAASGNDGLDGLSSAELGRLAEQSKIESGPGSPLDKAMRTAVIAELRARKVRAPVKADPAATSRNQINEDKLGDSTIADLKDLAEKEEVDLAGVTKKDDIIAAIRKARGEKAKA